MKGVRNIIPYENEILGVAANNVLMEITPDGRDGKLLFDGIYDFDLLYAALTEIKKKYAPLKKETRKNKPDRKQIQIVLKEMHTADAVLMFRVAGKISGVMTPSDGNFIALAPIVISEDKTSVFEDYDIALNTATLPSYVNPSDIPEVVLS